ncbi:hypothetical protein [Bosea sp. (in: a-proteobacteria)]|uniref:hypothetical protein n=1 Tax=Bosea sp. (in: a-proteobacteria) TaxID=1871050 RepID=UPI003F700DFF
MDRRSFITALIGGLAAASVGGIAAAEAAQPALPRDPDALSPDTAQAVDATEADFSQYYYGRRRHYRRPRHYYRRRHYRRHYYRGRYRRPDRRARPGTQR